MNIKYYTKTITAIGVILLLNACASTRPYVPTAAETSAAARSVDALNNTPSRSTTQPYTSPAPTPTRVAYQAPVIGSDTIAPQDVLDINVFKVPDLSAKGLIVESSGLISLPLVGSMRVAGLSISQAEQQITRKLTEFMQAPKVSIIRTNKALEKRVTVEGAVKTPGVFPIKGNLSFLQAIALAQGLNDVGDSRRVLFYRDGQQHMVNLDLVRRGVISDPALRGDDRIVVLKDNAKVKEKKVLEYLPAVTAPFSVLRGI